MATSQSAAGFVLDLEDAFEEEVSLPLLLITRKFGIDALSRIVMRSPVDTGRFRANWNVSFGAFDTSTTESKDKSGGETIGRGTVTVNGMQRPLVVWISNSLPYAEALESGHSKQAPLGMVAVTFAELSSIVGI